MAIRECSDCEYCKSLTDSEGNVIDFCMDTNGGNYLGVVGLCGYCTAENETDNLLDDEIEG